VSAATETEDDVQDILDNIRAHDPDGWATEPTEADYARFRDWIARKYGAGIGQFYYRKEENVYSYSYGE
jgi:hypothetical protein